MVRLSYINYKSHAQVRAKLTKFFLLLPENPSIPRNFEVALDGLSASLTWDPPSDLGSPELSHYSLVVVDDDGAVISNESVPAPGSTVTGLLPLTHYTIQLTAISQLSPVPVTSPTIEQEITTSTSGMDSCS